MDYLEIFKNFNSRSIHYIVVGGLAVNFLGVPRMTYDIDIVIDLDKKNNVETRYVYRRRRRRRTFAAKYVYEYR